MFIAFYHHLSVLLVLPPSFCFLLQPQIPSVSASIDCVPAGCSNVLCMNRAKYNPPICANDPDPSADCFSRATCAPSGDFRECAWVLTEDLTSCLRATGGYEDGTACDNNGGLNSAVAVDGCVITGCSSEICRKESVVSPCIFRER
ncbi:hypothetical protein BJ742DRAFT_797096 [Cladochytrium replicatum]|nr:hypothetical protein BJ742DRAFT_797096 [Cladochytrium replicatum]